MMAVDPPRPRMPPLNALRAFEAAARHQSFAKAADELGVTPAAVSHQIKSLEEWLGSTLFTRHAQGLSLTDAGRAALPSFSLAFDALGLAVQELRIWAPTSHVNIAALPSIAQLWLAPRLPALRQAFPESRPSIHALEQPPDFRREPFDLGVFLCKPGSAAGRSIEVCNDFIFPVCSPDVAQRLADPEDLVHVPLLMDTSWKSDWAIWLSEVGLKEVRIDEGAEFSLYSLALQAAIDGAGVLMGHEILVARSIAKGEVVAPFRHRTRTHLTLQLLAPDRPTTHASEIIEWLSSSA